MNNSVFKPICIALLCWFFAQNLVAQGWRRTFNVDTTNQFDWTRMVFQMSDYGYLLVGNGLLRTDANGDSLWHRSLPLQLNYYYGNNAATVLTDQSIVVAGNGGGPNLLLLGKYEPDGDSVWQREYDYGGANVEVSGLVVTPDGGFALMAHIVTTTGFIHVIKTDEAGVLEWSKPITPGTSNYLGRSLTLLSDGSFVVAGQKLVGQDWRANLIRIDSEGEVLWDSTYLDLTYASTVLETADQNLIVLGQQLSGSPNNDQAVFISKLDTNGQVIWQVFKGDFEAISPGDLIETKDGDFVACGEFRADDTVHNHGFLWKLDENGNESWFRAFNQDYNSHEFFKSVIQTSDGGFAIGGSQFDQPETYFDLLLIKTDTLGYDYSHHLIGQVFRDDDLGCDPDLGEAGLEGWLVTATDGEETYYSSTDANGFFDILLDTGSYEVSVDPYLYWANCQPSYTIDALHIYDTTMLDIPVQPAFLCPYMQVDLAPIQGLTLCSENTYSVTYCNLGTVPAEDATVQVTLADSLTYISATVPLLSQTGQVLIFDIGTVNDGDCGTFQIDFSLSCDLENFTRTLCSEAHIFPDTICIPDFWLGPNIRVEAGCEQDSVVFHIINEGGSMTEPAQYIVIEDNLIMMTSEFQLPAGGESEVRVEAADETTYHLIAAQVPDFPGQLGYPVATASWEGCVGNVNPGAFLQIPLDDGEPWIDISCQIVSNANSPAVALIAMPTGWQNEHFITNDTEIEYRIQFQNTSSSTATDVVVIDWLPAHLDPATIRLGASSHPYTFELTGQGTANFTFNDIMLADSISDEPSSHGFVQFTISQIPGTEPGMVIENSATVQFDYRTPSATNYVSHTVQAPWMTVVNGSVEAFVEEMTLKISPNPMHDQATLEAENLPTGENWLIVADGTGRVVLRQLFNQNKAIVQRGGLASGMYFFRVENAGSQVAVGKLVVR